MAILVVKPNKKGEIEQSVIPEHEFKNIQESHQEAITERTELLLNVFRNPDMVGMKSCSRCKKQGRVYLHPVENFSIVKSTGKRHSQCKRCRTEQSDAWCARRAAHRKRYHKKYREATRGKPKNANPAPRMKKNLQEIVTAKG